MKTVKIRNLPDVKSGCSQQLRPSTESKWDGVRLKLNFWTMFAFSFKIYIANLLPQEKIIEDVYTGFKTNKMLKIFSLIAEHSGFINHTLNKLD